MHKLTLAAISLALCSSSVGAAILDTQSAQIGPINLSATDSSSAPWPNPTETASSNSALSFYKFDASRGVLTGVSTALKINAGELTFSTSGTKASGNGTPNINVYGYVKAETTNLPGLSNNGQFGYINDDFNLGCSNYRPCFGYGPNVSSNPNLQRQDSTWGTGTFNATVFAPNLNAYVGVDQLSASLTVTNTVSFSKTTLIQDPRVE